MAHIYYSLAGEGRGHATRVRTVVEHLRTRHRVTIFAPGVAYDFLDAIYRDSEVTVRSIPGLLFHYRNQQMNHLLTGWEGAKYLARLPHLIRRLSSEIEAETPDLVITDFEPALPRAARRCGVPFLSLNHQHFLVVSDFPSLPTGLRWKAAAMAQGVKRYHSGEAEMIVSSFYFPPLKPKYQDVTQIGVLLRPAILDAVPTDRGHLLVYLRKFIEPHVEEALRRCGRPVRIYGVGERPADGNLTYQPISEHGFVEDLRTCSALFTTAGNQLVGEALYLGKPVLAFPEEKNAEQFINAHYLRESGGGEWCHLHELTTARLSRFLDALPDFECCWGPEQLHGLPTALDRIEAHLPSPVTPTDHDPLPTTSERVTALAGV